jgi:hypothetical protein
MILTEEDQTNIEEKSRKLSQIDADLIFVKLTGRNMISFTKNKDRTYDPKIVTPTLSEYHYLKRNNPKSTHKGKMNFEHFLKSIELVAVKLYPDYSLEEAI